ncbi:MAG: hypothetical protein WCP20_16680 [Desulfuromonadales bacterium]
MNMLKKLKLRILGAIVLVPLAILSGCTGDTNTTNTPTATDVVAGVLRDAQTGAPIVGAVIKSGWSSATTDATGNWNLGSPAIATNVTNGVPQGYAVSIDTRGVTAPINIAAQATKAATNYPNIVYRNVSASTPGAIAGVNVLTVGQQVVTIKGLVTLATTDAATTGGTVELYYTETQANNNFGIGATTVNTVALNGFVYKSSAIGADGTFTFTNCEYGANYTAAAANTAGTLYGSAIVANNGQMVANLIANVNIKIGTTDQQTQQIATVAATVGTAAATVTGASSTGVAAVPTFGTATSELNPGTTTVTYTFTKNFSAANLAYLATSQAGGQFYNDLYVQYASKAGNVPYSVATTANTIAITFETATSGIYAVDLCVAAGKLGLVNTGVAPANLYARARVVFSTTGGDSILAVGALRLYSINSATPTFTYDWAPVTGAKKYNVYAQAVQTFLDGTSNVHTWVLAPAGTVITANYTFSPAAFIAASWGPTLPIDVFYETDGVRLSYNLKVRAVNSDGLEAADQATANIVNVNNLPSMVAYSAFDGTDGKGLAPSAAASVDNTGINELIVAGGGSQKAAPDTTGYVAVGGSVGTQPTPAAATSISGFYGNVNAGAHTNDLVKAITFNRALIKSDVENVSKWTIVDAGTVSPSTTPGLNPAVFTAGKAVNAAITPTITKVIYNTQTRVALVHYTLAYSFSTDSTDAVGTTYSLAKPLSFGFYCTATDLAGNAILKVSNMKGFF